MTIIVNQLEAGIFLGYGLVGKESVIQVKSESWGLTGTFHKAFPENISPSSIFNIILCDLKMGFFVT